MNQKLNVFVRFFILVVLVVAGLPFNTQPAQAAAAPAGLSTAAWDSMQAQMAAVNNLPVAQIKKLTASTPQANSKLGVNTGYALQGDVAVVSTAWEDVASNIDEGAAYVFYRNFNNGTADDWQLVKRLTASNGAANNHFGISAAISGDRIFIGAEFQKAVYVFERNSGGMNNWGETKIITSGDPLAGAFGIAVAAFGDSLTVGASYADVSGNDNRGAAYIFSRNQGGADNWGLVKKLTASDAADADYFGSTVDMSADVIAVGVEQADVAGNADQGAVYLYYRNTGGAENWGEVKKITAPDGAAGDKFGSSISLERDTLAVGALFADINGKTNQGAAYLFGRNQGGLNNWGQLTKLVANDGLGTNYFGSAVDLKNDLLAVSAEYGTINTYNEGSVYLFARNQGGADSWGQTREIVASDGGELAHFENVALDGNTLLVAAPYADVDGQTDAGAAYIFYIQGTGWSQSAKTSSGTPLAGSKEGNAIALDGEYLVTGAPLYDANAVTDSGEAYLYRRNAGGADAWDLLKTLDAPTPTIGEYFGQAVSISDDTIAIGAPSSNNVYIFLRNSGGADNWGLFKTISGASGEKFGTSLSLVGDLLAVGAPAANSNTGAAYIYERNQTGADAWGLVKTIGGAVAGGQLGFSLDLEAGQLLVGAPSTSNGTAYLYLRNEGGADNWGKYKELTTSNGAAGDGFGWAVSISDDTILIGAPNDDDTTLGVDAGAAYIFIRNQGGVDNWGEKTALADPFGAADNRFGFAVDVNGDTALVGSPRAVIGGNLVQGSASLYERNTTGFDAWGRTQRLTAADGRADDRFGYAVALTDRFIALGAATVDLGAAANAGAAYVYQYDQTFNLILTKNGSGTVTDDLGLLDCVANCVVPYTTGTTVSLTATPAAGAVFTGWGGDCTGTAGCTVSMSGAHSVTATFQPVYTLTVTKQGSGSGTVSSIPTGINCGADCTENYLVNTSVKLTAAPAAGSVFIGFSGDTGCSTGTVSMTTSKTCTAKFAAVVTTTLFSVAAHDGYLLESAENSNLAGTMDAASGLIYLGDDAQDRQYRAILSFATASLPDNAIITVAALKLKSAGIIGTNPFTTHTALRGDMRKGFFDTAAALALKDFSTAASLDNALTFGITPANNWYTAYLPAAAIQQINLVSTSGGVTQFRLRFAKDDNDDLGADYIKFNSGNAPADKPMLVIKYYVP